MLVDRVTVHLKSGKGGDGCESFECRGPKKYYPMGGDGGKGGDIIIRAVSNLSSLDFFKYNPHQKAESAQQGSSNKKKGKCGKDLVLKVPYGTRVFSKADGYLLRELLRDGDDFVVLQGGGPGRGNHDNKTPSKGQPGRELDIILDYRITSDIALVGLPHSGKSSFLAKITNAKVCPAEYAFSTKVPQLGSHQLEDFSRIILCDLPSIYAGSADGKGLGNGFLKHALNTKLLFLFLDIQSDFCVSLYEGFLAIKNEIKMFNEELALKDTFVVVNKCDLDSDDEVIGEINKIKNESKHVALISTITGEGISGLIADAVSIMAD